MLRASQAIRMGLRAASRNAELSFVKALLDLMGSVLGLLPLLAVGLFLWRAVSGQPALRGLLHAAEAVRRLGWPLAGALFTASVLSWAIAAGFWAGALPILAVDVEMDERPPGGLFLRLAPAGFARVAGASAISSSLSLLVGLVILVAILVGVPLFLLRPTAPLAAGLAAVLTCSFGTGFLVDLVGSLALVRAAVLGDGPALSFVRAARLFGERLGSALIIAFAFLMLELMLATALGALVGPALADGLDLDGQLLALGPRIALSIASTAVLAWLELARQGALASLAADAEGLLKLPAEPEPPRVVQPRRQVQVWELRPPRVAVQPDTPERIIEALPVPEESVIEALPVAEEPAGDATGAPPPEGLG